MLYSGQLHQMPSQVRLAKETKRPHGIVTGDAVGGQRCGRNSFGEGKYCPQLERLACR